MIKKNKHSAIGESEPAKSKTKVLDKITSADVDKLSHEERVVLDRNIQKFGTFMMTRTEYIVYRQLIDEHLHCMRNDDGSPRFGAIGGGTVVRFEIDPKTRERVVIFRCEGCDTEVNITAKAKEYEDRYAHYIMYPDKMNEIEYLRYEKFLKCYVKEGEKVSVGFMGTGLGSCIDVINEDTDVCADITDSGSW